MLRECLLSILGDDKRSTGVFKDAMRGAKSYKQIKSNAFHPLKAVLKETERIPDAFGLIVDFSKGDGLRSHTGLFPETEFVEMLEASDYNPINEVFYFLEAIADTFCGNVNNSEVTRVFIFYVHLLRVNNRINRDPW